MKPLEGIKVLDLTRLLPGPLCTMHLGDLGAEIIKVEDTNGGDYARYLPPIQKKISKFFLTINRNKKSIKLDLTKDEGQQIIYQLIKNTDVVIESFRPGVTKKLGIDYQKLQKINPKLIYASITGYGQTGSYKSKAGHDLNFIASAGILNATEGKPQIPNFQLGDIVGGTQTAVMSVLAAIIQQKNTGKGQYLDIAMMDAAITNNVMGYSMLEAKTKTEREILMGTWHCYSIYETKDHKYMAVAALEYKFWQRFCDAVNCEEWKEKHLVPEEEIPKIKAAIQTLFMSKTQEEWSAIFEKVDCCVSPVLSLQEAINSKYVKERKLLFENIHPTEGIVKQFAFPVNISDQEKSTHIPTPQYGEHTNEILKSIGLNPEEIKLLKKKNVI